MKTLRKTDLESMEKELQVLRNPKGILGGTKGDDYDPYTLGEFNNLYNSGAWTGGYVEGYGWVDAFLGGGTFLSGYGGSGGSSSGSMAPSLSGQLTLLLSSGSVYISNVITFILSVPEFSGLQGLSDMIYDLTVHNGATGGGIVEVNPISTGFRISVNNHIYNLLCAVA